MKTLCAALLCMGMGLALTPSAEAASQQTIAGMTDPALTLASGGCGPYGFRDRFGYCRPRVPPRYRACPPGYHPTPRGCFPNY